MRIRVLAVSISILCAGAFPLFVAAYAPNQAPAPAGLTAPAGTAGANVTASDPKAKSCILKLFKDQAAKQKAAGKTPGALTDGLTDSCTDETVTQDAKTGKRIYTQTGREGNKNDITIQGECVADSCKSACGMITVIIPGMAAQKPVSKCDPLGKAIVDSANGSTTGMKDYALNAINQKAIQDIIDGTDTTKKQSLLESFGIPSEQAAKLVTNQPQDTNALLSAFASGDSAKIDAAATSAGISLNSDTINNITSLTPQQLSKNLSDSSLLSDAQQTTVNNINNSPSTFSPTDPTTTSPVLRGGQYADMFHEIETKNNLPVGYLTSNCTVESKCNPNSCATGISSACGMFQQIRGTWAEDSRRYNLAVNGIDAPLDLNLRSDPRTAAEVTGFTAGYYEKAYANTIQNATNAGMDPSVALYSLHNLGSGGGPRFMNGYAQNPNQAVNQVLTATEIRNNPSLYGDGSITLAQAQSNIIARMNGTATFNSPSQMASFQSPFGLGGGGITQDTSFIANGQSPFANVSFIPPNAYPQSAPQGLGQLTPVSYPQNTSSGGNTSSSGSGNTSSSNSTNTIPTGKSGSAVAQIIVQPATVLHDSSVSVSWSSAGVGAANSCSVYEGNDTIIAQGNEGTQQIPLSTAGTVVFSVKCTVQGSGQQISSSASVKVQ